MHLASVECLILEMAAWNTSLVELFSDPFSFYALIGLEDVFFSVEVRKKTKKEGGIASRIQCINKKFKYTNEKIRIERIREL